jgi:hypothetical protein
MPIMCNSWYIIHLNIGKHKDHDVKTIRKSQPLIKS